MHVAHVTRGEALTWPGVWRQRSRTIASIAQASVGLAATAFESFGSLRYRNQAERELRKLGRHIPRRTRPGAHDARGIAALTARELEIARLVVDSKTNPQIAAELYLSKKTVETHLRHSFEKMDVPSRVCLARAVERGHRTASARPS